MTQCFGIHKHLSSNCQYNSQLCHVDVPHRVANHVTWGSIGKLIMEAYMCMQNCFFQANKNLSFQKGRAKRNNSLTHCCGCMAGGHQVIIWFPFCNNHGLNFGNWCLSVSSELDRVQRLVLAGILWSSVSPLKFLGTFSHSIAHPPHINHLFQLITKTSTDQPSVLIQSQNPSYLEL